ncbi:MAG: hypothetical protein MJ074_06835 [Oscillospiraceae bacterium]|nr:hypothetical protein [Oscillospiraceae bacterium]
MAKKKESVEEQERICAYMEAMADKYGAKIQVYTNASGEYIMRRSGDETGYEFPVSMEEPKEEFLKKCRLLMRGEWR